MTNRRRWRDWLSRHVGALLALALFAASMAAARTFAPTPAATGPEQSHVAGPGSSIAYGIYGGPALRGVFAGCNPDCDLIIATEGVAWRLTFTDGTIDESAPAISPDGTRVAFRCAEPGVEQTGAESSRPAGPGAICMVALLGNRPEATPPPTTTLLSDPDIDYDAPAFSPDGLALAFGFRTADGEAGIGVLEIASRRQTRQTGEDLQGSNPAWSPDGVSLAFNCGAIPGPSGTELTQFCLMPSAGGDVRRLGAVHGACGTPTFVPDGMHLAVVCVVPDAAGGDLFMLAVNEQLSRSYTTSQLIAPEGIRRVAFSPDGAYAYVRRGNALWAINFTDGAWSMPSLPPLKGDFDVRVLP